jgi:ABC-type multidrug transport system ATPase subunit
MPPCVQISELTKCYGSVVAVSGLSLDIEHGEVFGLLGPNGAGKSTTLHMLSGLMAPNSGTMTLFGKDLRKNFLEIIPRVGVLVERPAFYNYLTARRNMKIFARLSGRQVTVDRALDRVGLLHAAGKKVGTYSHGMRQRLGIALALMTEPELLLLDEPTAGLDVESTQEVLHLLRFLADEAKVTTIVSSHMLHEVEQLCDRVAVLNRGRLLACEETGALLSYDMSHVEVLIDAPEAAARRLGEEEWVVSAEVAGGRLAIALQDGNVHQLTAFLVGLGYKVSGVIPRRRTLQDYFLKVLNT